MSIAAKRRSRSLNKRWAAFAARTRVAASSLLALATCVLADPTRESVMAGIPVALVGVAIRTWAAGHVRKNQQLAISGPYAYVRNPLYIGSLIAGIGLGISSGRVSILIAIITLFAIWFRPVIAEEEEHLREIIPGFREYEQKVPRFLPSLSSRLEARMRFDWSTYLQNREYEAVLAFGAFLLVLWFKLEFL